METIKIVVGSPNFGKGKTTVIISDKGLVQASNICEQETSSCTLEFPKEDAKAIFSEIQNRIRQIPESKKRKGVPGEVEYEIEVSDGLNKSEHYQVWDNDISKDVELKNVFRRLRENILKYSEQKILL